VGDFALASARQDQEVGNRAKDSNTLEVYLQYEEEPAFDVRGDGLIQGSGVGARVTSQDGAAPDDGLQQLAHAVRICGHALRQQGQQREEGGIGGFSGAIAALSAGHEWAIFSSVHIIAIVSCTQIFLYTSLGISTPGKMNRECFT